MTRNTQDELLSASQVEEILKDRNSGKMRLHRRQNGHLVVDHAKTANAMVMFIANIPMDKFIKKILIMRLGCPLINKKPMTHLQVALQLGMKEAEVVELEQVGLQECNSYMERVTGGVLALPGNASLIEDTLNDVVRSKKIIQGEG